MYFARPYIDSFTVGSSLAKVLSCHTNDLCVKFHESLIGFTNIRLQHCKGVRVKEYEIASKQSNY